MRPGREEVLAQQLVAHEHDIGEVQVKIVLHLDRQLDGVFQAGHYAGGGAGEDVCLIIQKDTHGGNTIGNMVR